MTEPAPQVVMTNGSDVGNMLRGGAPPVIERQVVAPVPHISAPPRPNTVQVEILRDGHTSESISFVRGRGAHNTKGSDQETVGSAGASFKIVGPESLSAVPTAAPVASAPPAGSIASTASGRNTARVEAPSTMSFSRAPEESPFFAGPNSKTVNVP